MFALDAHEQSVAFGFAFVASAFAFCALRLPLCAAEAVSFTKLDPKVLRQVEGALKTTGIQCYLETVWFIASAVGHFGRWLKGCPCHEAARKATGDKAKRRRLVQNAGGLGQHGKCPWVGRRGTEMALGKLDEFTNMLLSARSDDANILHAKLDSTVSSNILRFEHSVKNRIADIWILKLSMWKHLPYSIIGIGGNSFGAKSNLQDCKILAKRIREEYDLNPHKRVIHRVAHVFLAESSDLRRQWIHFESSEFPLESYPKLCFETMSYAFASLSEVSAEGEHSRIHGLLMHPGRPQSPPAICAQLRKREVVALLANPAFLRWAGPMWRSRMLYVRLLDFKMSAAKLKELPIKDILGQIYSCRREDHYRDLSLSDRMRAPPCKRIQVSSALSPPG